MAWRCNISGATTGLTKAKAASQALKDIVPEFLEPHDMSMKLLLLNKLDPSRESAVCRSRQSRNNYDADDHTIRRDELS